MATIIANKKGGKLISYKFKVCLGRDTSGKQIIKCTTWIPPEGLTPAKQKKAATLAAMAWEDKTKEQHALGVNSYQREESECQSTLANFIHEVWLPLRVHSGRVKPSTMTFYTHISKAIVGKLGYLPLDAISAMDIERYLLYVKNEWISALGKPASEKTVRHHYNILGIIFNYAEKQDFICKNPMKKVDAPKITRKPVEAMTETQTKMFFQALETHSLEFRCMMHLMITTGVRRGECLGLMWKDVDFSAATIKIQQNVTYTKASGTVVDVPKTANSIRTIPLMKSTVSLLQVLLETFRRKYPNTKPNDAFLFFGESSIYGPRDPNTVTRDVKKFMKKIGLPTISPHDLRHTCASLLLSNGADIKSVQQILGHADASTTLNYYVKSDLQQMKSATERYAKAFDL